MDMKVFEASEPAAPKNAEGRSYPIQKKIIRVQVWILNRKRPRIILIHQFSELLSYHATGGGGAINVTELSSTSPPFHNHHFHLLLLLLHIRFRVVSKLSQNTNLQSNN